MRKAKAYSKMIQNMKGVQPRRKNSDKISNKPSCSLLPAKGADSKRKKVYPYHEIARVL